MEFEHKVAALDDEDLVVGEKEEKNWKGIVISLLVIGSIMGAIVISIMLCTPDGDADSNKMRLDLDHVVSEAYKPQTFNGAWLSSHEIVYVDQNGSIVIFDANTNKSSAVLMERDLKTLHTMRGFKVSADRQSILFATDVRYEFGARKSARYAIYNISSQTVEFLDDFVKSSSINQNQQPATRQVQIQYATWGQAPNSILFIESNDIFYIPDYAAASQLASSTSGAGKYFRLTKTGALSDSITNGLPDSLYRANIFNPQTNEVALWWSADGRYLAYLSFDDALVEQSPIEYYDNYMMHESSNNPKIHYERYPRAGGLNPHVSVHVVDLINPSGSGGEGDYESSVITAPIELLKQQQLDPRMAYYITYVGWLAASPLNGNGNQLLIMWSNRAQNSSLLSLCEDGDKTGQRYGLWKCDLLTTFAHRIPPNFDANRNILATHNINGTRLIFFALPRPDSIIGDHYHVAMLRGEERARKYLTHGPYDIDRLLTYDPMSDSLYFEAKTNYDGERHLYKISHISQMQSMQTHCLTCYLQEPCSYNYAHVSQWPGARHFVHECLGPEVPVSRMRQLIGHNDSLPSQMILNVDKHTENLVRSKQMPTERFIRLKKSPQFPYDIQIKLYLPNESEDEKDKRFPLLIESSDIGRRNVWRRFELDLGKYLASRKQVAYAKIDCIKDGPQMPPHSSDHQSAYSGPGLGSSSHGESTFSGLAASSGGGSSMGSSISYETGSVSGLKGISGDDIDELESPLMNARVQVEAIKYIIENPDLFPFIDRRRVAILGPTSTSAYVALASTLYDESKLIQCTIAVSPITNWRYMSSYAAEHYFGLPWLESSNMKYERSNLLKRSHEFAMRKLLIVHGTADEQVHVQHSMQFIKALTEHHPLGGVIHQMQLYPDVGHSLEPVKKHFYLTLDGFIDRCFYQKPITIKATEWKGKRPKLY